MALIEARRISKVYRLGDIDLHAADLKDLADRQPRGGGNPDQ